MDMQKIARYADFIRRSFKANDDVRDSRLAYPDGIRSICDIKYSDKDILNVLDIYYPAVEQPTYKTIVNIHGGAYVYGDKERYKFYCMYLASKGFAVVNFSYRLAPESPYPAALEDVNSVFHFIADNYTQYKFDIENVFAAGDSAGAQLAAQYAAILTSDKYRQHFNFNIPEIKIKGCLLNCGMYDLKKQFETGAKNKKMFQAYFQGREGEYADHLLTLEAVNENFPPSYIMTAYYDFLRDDGVEFAEILKKNGVKYSFRMFGDETTQDMSHVFHLNIRTNEAKLCNDEECEFLFSL